MTLVSKLGALGAGTLLVVGSSAATVAIAGHDHHDAAPRIGPAASSGTAQPVSNAGPDAARRVYDGAKQSVAYISAATPEGQATGSGFVVSADGKIVTNEHVVDGAQQVTVKLGTGGQEQDATVLAADASKDLALLAIDTGGKALNAMPLADSSKVQVGDTTYAIG